jgi:hypothetical protein
MRPLFCFALLLGIAVSASAQSLDDMNVQIHGYAAQGFLYTTHNNVFYANSSSGSLAWTEAVVNVSLQPKPSLRVGVQARYQLLGTSGNAITLDWAAVDFQINDHLGVRAGKVKTPWGLFNETQDLDPAYMWALLPQSIYDITTRESDLSHYGAVAYGSNELCAKCGKLDYDLWGGEAVVPASDGQFDDLNASGNGPLNSLEYITFGGALHWRLPISGLMVGASDASNRPATVALNGGSESFAEWNNQSYFGQYTKKEAMFAAEWNRQASPATLNLTGQPVSSASSDTRSWYGMATYKVTSKLTAGAYDSQFFDHDAPLGIGRFTKDWTVSGRYDLNEFVYIKADEHFIDGTALSLDSAQNLNPKPVYKLTALRLGVSF